MTVETRAPGLAVPLADGGDRGHPDSSKVYVALLALLAVSLVAPAALPFGFAVAVISVAALAKAALVVANFMHLRYEPLILWLAVGVVAFVFAAFVLAVYPDIPLVPLEPYRP